MGDFHLSSTKKGIQYFDNFRPRSFLLSTSGLESVAVILRLLLMLSHCYKTSGIKMEIKWILEFVYEQLVKDSL